MTHIIGDPCIGTKDTSCVAVCPVDCIHPTKEDPDFEKEEMLFILEHHWATLGLTLEQADFTDMEAVSAVVRITHGNFRLLQRLFTQIKRIMNLNTLTTVTREVVEAARECLVIGNV